VAVKEYLVREMKTAEKFLKLQQKVSGENQTKAIPEPQFQRPSGIDELFKTLKI
jgi:hypothetical protein